MESVIVMGVVCCALIFALLWQTRQFGRERADWIDERRFLIDRAIARHAGEIVMMDKTREQGPQVATGPRPEEPHPVGL